MIIPYYYKLALASLFVFAIITFLALHFIPAPYGRHHRKNWGFNISSRLGWIIMEMPAATVFAWVYIHGPSANKLAPLVFFMMWELHYIHRTFIFPFRMRNKKKAMPLLIASMGFLFNTLNASLNAYWISTLASYPNNWLKQPLFLVGLLLFIIGFYINFRSDQILFRLRGPNETGYKIPQTFLHRWVCSPNYLGEILEWSAFALATWSLPALAFALYTIANLAPRAATHLRWYRSSFPDYPLNRRALIPYIW